MDKMRIWIELAATGIETLAVTIMVGFILIVTARWLLHIGRRNEGAYELLWEDLSWSGSSF
jgi:hypothetical protein